jgi:predicted dehydrogenase
VATIAGLEKGMHVFCEKPPGRDLKDIADVVRTHAKFNKQKLMYGFNHRYHDSVREAMRLIRSNEMGKVINLRGVYGKSVMINFENDWRTQRSVSGGGILLDQGIHLVDLMRLFGGEFIDVKSFISNDFWGHDVEDNAYAIMRTQAGVVGMLHSSATQWRHRFHLEIALEEGTIILSGILSGTKSYGAETITVSRRGMSDKGDPKETTIRYNEDNSWKDEIWEFTESILTDRTIEVGSATDAYKTMELVYKIYCADESWKTKYELSDKI